MLTPLNLQRWICRIAVGILGATVCGMFFVASVVRVIYYDLALYLNGAWSMVSDNVPYSVIFPVTRPPFYALLLAPFMALAENPPFGIAVRGPLLLGAVFGCGMLALTFCLLKRHYPVWCAWLSTCLLGLCSLVVHYSPLGMHDVAAATFTLGAVVAFEQAVGRDAPDRRWLATAAVCAGCAIAIRHTVGLLLPSLAAAAVIGTWQRKKTWRTLPPLTACVITPAAAIIATLGLLWLAAAISAGSPTGGIALLKQYWWSLPWGAGVDNPSDPWYEYLVQAPYVWAAPLLLLAAYGAVVRARHYETTDWAVLLFSGSYFIYHAFIFKHHELRYLLPVCFAVPYFAARGLAATADAGGRDGENAPRRGARWLLAAWALAFFWQAWLGAREWWHFRDPIYTEPYLEAFLAETRQRIGEDRPVYFHGLMTPVVPRDYVFHPLDEHFYIYHVGATHLYLWLSERIQRLHEPPGQSQTLNLARREATVVFLYPHFTTTTTMPPVPPGLVARHYRLLEFIRQDDGWVTAAAPRAAALTADQTGERLRLQNSDVQNGLLLVCSDGANHAFPITDGWVNGIDPPRLATAQTVAVAGYVERTAYPPHTTPPPNRRGAWWLRDRQ